MAKNWHALNIEEIYKELGSSADGLSREGVEKNLSKYGENTIEIEKKTSALSMFLSQFRNIPVLLLLAAATISFSIGIFGNDKENLFDSLLIFIIVLANAIFGFAQEYRAEKSIEALKKMVVKSATVVRDGQEKEIEARFLVPGDIVLVKEGDIIPADLRVMESFSFSADESILTGESIPSSKSVDVIKEAASPVDRKNMLYMNTNAIRGRAKTIVVETGLNTEIGKIAKEIAEAENKTTQFELETEDLGKKIAIAVFVIMLIIAGVELFIRKGEILGVIIISISLGVAAIPEGLPAVVTLSLAFGANKMVKQNALIRKLGTIENFSAVDVICTDKTGTITENVMTVTKIYSDEKVINVSGKGREIKGNFSINNKFVETKSIEFLFKCALLCNDSKFDKETNKFSGDPTEIAVSIPAYKSGLEFEQVKKEYIRLNEIPFSSARKMMSTLNSFGDEIFVFSKGAPEVILSKCTKILENDKEIKLTKEQKEKILKQNDLFGSQALRVLAFAYKKADSKIKNPDFESNLVFLGLMGIIDPPREGVREAIADCKAAGIRIVMVTGDNKLTAQAVGSEIGLGTNSISAEELDTLNEYELSKLVEKIDIYARVSPLNKVRILKALQANGHVVAMTGDGVNDAAAVKNADVGISMGIRGSDVTKGASDMILLDDNFITIKNAIAQGRGIYDNIRKFVVYLLGANLAEVLVIFLASILGLGLPLVAIHLLWINLLTDGLPALAIGVDPVSKDIMKREPRAKEESILNKDAILFILSLGLSATLVYLILFAYTLAEGIRKAQTIVFTAFIVFEMAKVYITRSRYGADWLSNKWLHISVLLSILLQALVLFTPLGTYFKVVPLNINDFTLLGVSLLGFLGVYLLVSRIIRILGTSKAQNN